MPLNFEFKARCSDIEKAETILQQQQPLFIGTDHQTDTYFNVSKGRLKLREGNIENALIYYERNNTPGVKLSNVLLYQHLPDKMLKAILTISLGVKTVVEKVRKIYFIDNVKFHFDKVKGLGSFLEVEAIDKNGTIGVVKLKKQCENYFRLLEIQPENFIALSYSDMLLEKNPQ